jgi:hypothetical protein
MWVVTDPFEASYSGVSAPLSLRFSVRAFVALRTPLSGFGSKAEFLA